MKYGVTLPPFGDFADPRFLANAAKEAEEAGWDGFFIWDHVFFDPSFHPNLDPWVGLAAAAMNTQRVRIGTLVTPVARRRPWVLARQTVAVDRLSGGRLVLGVGLGDPVQWDYGFFHEETDAKVRAQKLDEGLDILAGLWTGDFFAYRGEQYQLERVRFRPTPLQSPRTPAPAAAPPGARAGVPVWVGGNWPNKGPMRRAARWDGYVPLKWEGGMTPDLWREALEYIRRFRETDAPFDAVHGGKTPLEAWRNAGDLIQPFAEAGVTWWIEDVSPWRFGHSWEVQWQAEFTTQMSELIRLGPPRT